MSESTELLQKHFDLALEAPEGIQRLRELILTLAMQGKLVPQNPKDPPASRQVSNKDHSVARVWRMSILADVGTWAVGSGFPHEVQGNSDEEILMCKVSDMNLPGNEKFLVTANNTISVELAKRTKINIHEPGTVVFPKIGGAIATNKRRILTRKTAIDNNCLGITPYTDIDTEWLFRLLSSIDLSKYQSGTTVPSISQGVIGQIPVAIPPLPEQHRIVAKVDQLMAVCDQLEKQRDALAQKRLAVHNAAIRRLLEAGEQVEFASAWDFLVDHFSVVYTVKENVAELRKAILQLTVMGKLVKQDPDDPPASELLKEIEEEKRRLVKEGKIKAPKPLPPIAPEEAPFAVPTGWDWVRLEEITSLITKGSSPTWQGVSYTDDPNDILFVTSENVGSFELKLQSKKYVERKFNEIEPRSILAKGDFLMNIVGASIGRTAVYDIDDEANINQAVCLIRCFVEHLEPQYLLLFFNSSVCIGYMFDKQVENARANLSMGNIARFPIPLPPLPEQHRIVAKVNELMALCDRLEARIDAENQKKSSLLKAVLAAV